MLLTTLILLFVLPLLTVAIKREFNYHIRAHSFRPVKITAQIFVCSAIVVNAANFLNPFMSGNPTVTMVRLVCTYLNTSLIAVFYGLEIFYITSSNIFTENEAESPRLITKYAGFPALAVMIAAVAVGPDSDFLFGVWFLLIGATFFFLQVFVLRHVTEMIAMVQGGLVDVSNRISSLSPRDSRLSTMNESLLEPQLSKESIADTIRRLKCFQYFSSFVCFLAVIGQVYYGIVLLTDNVDLLKDSMCPDYLSFVFTTLQSMVMVFGCWLGWDSDNKS
jgi:hypothetical protein